MLKTFKFPIILIFSICFILVIGAWAYSQTETIPMDTEIPSVYIVKKGDTLWDISEKFFLDSSSWPELWELNSFVEDPHWIYPGQPIILPKPESKKKNRKKKNLNLRLLFLNHQK